MLGNGAAQGLNSDIRVRHLNISCINTHIQRICAPYNSGDREPLLSWSPVEPFAFFGASFQPSGCGVQDQSLRTKTNLLRAYRSFVMIISTEYITHTE